MRDKRITKEQRRHITNARREAHGNNFRESEKFLVATMHLNYCSHNRQNNGQNNNEDEGVFEDEFENVY